MAKAKKEPLTPQEFFALDVSKKIHWLAMSYMNRCCAEGFTKKGLFQLRNYFKRIEVSKLQVFYDYISSIEEPTVVSVYDLYAKSEAHQLKLRMAVDNKAVEVPQYQSLLSCLEGL